jgi:hypothetical protein
MAKRKTLVKNKKKKRQTKKRILKKYIGGNDREIHDFLLIRFPEINELITSCFEGNECHRKEITTSIMRKNMDPVHKTEILSYVDRQMKLELNQREGISEAKKDEFEKAQKLREKEEAAVQNFKGKTELWEFIKNSLSEKYDFAKIGLQVERDGINNPNYNSARDTILYAVDSLEKFKTDIDYIEKKTKFYEWLYKFGEINKDFKNIRKLVLSYCLREEIEKVYYSIIETPDVKHYEEFLNWLKTDTNYFLKIDIQYIVGWILNLHIRISDYFKDKPERVNKTQNFTNDGFIILMNRLFKNYIYNKLRHFSDKSTWREELKSKVNTFFESIFSISVVIREKKCYFLLRTYYNLVTLYMTPNLLNTICKIVTFKRINFSIFHIGKSVKPNSCDKGLAEKDETYKKIKIFIKSVAEAIIDTKKNIESL